MSRSSLNLTNCFLAAILIATMLHAPPVRANAKRDLLAQAKAAEQRRDFNAAEKTYCDLLLVDSRNKEAQSKCAYYRAAHEKLQRGVAAYMKNDFAGAKRLLMEVSSLEPNAEVCISKINRYTQYFDDGFRLAKTGKSAEAIEQYRRAQRIKPDGPWDLKSKIANLEEKLSLEPKPLSDEDQKLIQAITDFYNGSYSSAEQKLASYNGQEKKRALALFYLGASELSRYYLAGAKQFDDELYRSAVSHFADAKKAARDFAPPAPQVSPKILKVYAEASQ